LYRRCARLEQRIPGDLVRRSVIGCLLLALATTVSAQHYDPYYVFPGPKGRIAADLGLFADDVSRIADASSTITSRKLSISDEWEVGLAVDLGLLRDHAGTLSSVQVGTKLGLDEHMALTGAAVLPLGETDDLGLSVGLMKTFLAAQHMVNTWTSAALLDGYTGKGVALSVLIEPTRSVGDRITGYLDVNVRSNTEAL
tara:strand:- start:96 stop:689 length:594 start_codon:yes stop_codon:yes gene_type:complete